MAQPAERPTLSLSSGHGLGVVGSSPVLGSVLSSELAWGSLPLPLSKMNLKILKKKKKPTFRAGWAREYGLWRWTELRTGAVSPAQPSARGTGQLPTHEPSFLGQNQMLLGNLLREPSGSGPIVSIAELPVGPIVGPPWSMVPSSPASPRPPSGYHLPGEGEHTGGEGPGLQGAGDCL